jgi:hypothetical protein
MLHRSFFHVLRGAPFFRSGAKRATVRKVPKSKATEAGLDSALTPRKRRVKSPVAGGQAEKKQKGHSTKSSGTEAKQEPKGSESLASKEAQTAEAKKKATEAAKT